jgi:hypothetical protein
LELRLSKYDPKYRNTDGAYSKNEWTAISDIGKSFEGEALEYDTYIETETRYVTVIQELFNLNKILNFEIHDLEDNSSISAKDYFRDIANIRIGELHGRISADIVPTILRLGLREIIWARLIGKSDRCTMEVEFGYDYYIRLHANNLCILDFNLARKHGLFLENIPD